MDVQCIVNRNMKLSDQTGKMYLTTPLAYNNALAHAMRVTVFNDDGTAADLSTVGVTGVFLNASGESISPINGTASGNVAQIILPAICYTTPGRFSFTMNLTDSASGASRTALWVDGFVERNTSETIVAPGSPVSSIDQAIGQANAAANAANTAAAAAQEVVDAHFQDTGRFVSANGQANADYAVSEGSITRANGQSSHAEGNSTRANGQCSHAEGSATFANGYASHGEGISCSISEDAMCGHAEGLSCKTQGNYAHSEGHNTQAMGESSHTDGLGSYAAYRSQHVFGEYNTIDSKSDATASGRGNYVEIVGNGDGKSSRSNARTLDWSGNEELAGDLTINKGGANETSVTAMAAVVAGLPKIQYGMGTTNSSTGILDVEFDTPFSEAPVVIITPHSGTNSDVANTARLVSVSASGFRCIGVSVSKTSSSQTVTIRPDTNHDIRWLAIGT